jgi:hypothetical protein
MPASVARALQMNALFTPQAVRVIPRSGTKQRSSLLYIRRHCAINPGSAVQTGTQQPGVLRQRVPEFGEGFRTMSLYLEGH